MPPRKKLSETLDSSRRWEGFVELELCWSLLHCAIIEGRRHARVPVLSMDLLDLILDSISDNLMEVPYPGSYNGTPSDTVKDPLQANAIGRRLENEVVFPISSEHVRYTSLGRLQDKSIERQAVCELLPVENGVVVLPVMRAKLERVIKEKAKTETKKDMADGDNNGHGSPVSGQTPLVAVSSEPRNSASGLVEESGDKSSPVACLSPVGT